MLLSFSLLGLILSAILLFFNAGKFKSSIYLGAFFFLVSLYGFTQYALLYSKSTLLIAFVYINTGFLSYFIGPALYLYIKSVLTDKAAMRRRDSIHLLPALIFLIAALPHIFTSWSHKVSIATKLADDPSSIAGFSSSLLQNVIPYSVIYLSRPFLVLAYAIASTILVVKYRRTKTKAFSSQLYMIHWLAFLLGLLFVLVISHILILRHTLISRNLEFFFTLNLLQVLSATGLAGLLMLPFFFPSILYGLPRPPEAFLLATPLPAEAKRTHNSFESDYLLSIGQKADSCMKDLSPYLQVDFNLAQFSVLIHVPIHHLAYYFREEKKQSFIDFRNEWRINHATMLIKEGKATELTLEAIGNLSGFSNRNTFFIAFKKVQGISPGAFVSQFTE